MEQQLLCLLMTPNATNQLTTLVIALIFHMTFISFTTGSLDEV